MEEILITSTLDGTEQPNLFYSAEGSEKRPLLVGLHTWSFNRFNQVENLLPLAKENNFNLLLPEFRGPNLFGNKDREKACGSEYAKQDICDAVDYIINSKNIDTDNIFVLGLSGGGHMALLMAGYKPELFRAVAAFVPICDLEEWTKQSPGYKNHILACCSDDVEEMKKRSPISYLESISKTTVKLFHGKWDNVVPYTQSLNFYKEMITFYPASRTFLDIFDGGHQIDLKLAFHFILSQYKKTEITTITG